MASIFRSKRRLLRDRRQRLARMADAFHIKQMRQRIVIPCPFEFDAHGQWNRVAKAQVAMAPVDARAPQGADVAQPWWIVVEGLEMIGSRRHAVLAVPPLGAPPPSWESVAIEASRLWEKAATERGHESVEEANDVGAPSPKRSPLLLLDTALGGRAVWIKASVPIGWRFSGSRASRAVVESLDWRRAKRRLGKPPAPICSETFGEAGPEAWSRGASLEGLRRAEKHFDPVAHALRALALAARSHGALDAWPLGEPLAPSQTDLASTTALEAFDPQLSDPLRARWALEQSAAPSAPSRKPSL